MTDNESVDDKFIKFILEQANEKDQEMALSNIVDRFIKDNAKLYNDLVEQVTDDRANALIQRKYNPPPKEKVRKDIEYAIRPSFLELKKELEEQNKSTLRKAADASLKIVEKFCYAALGAVSLAFGSVVMLEGKALKFGTLGLYNSFDATSRPVRADEAHDFSKGKIGITRKGGRINQVEELGYEGLQAGASFVKQAYTKIIKDKQNTTTMAQKVKDDAQNVRTKGK